MPEQLILLSRDETACLRTQAALQEAGVPGPVLIAPLVRLTFEPLPVCPAGRAFLITSHGLCQHLPEAYLRGRDVFVVGQASAERLQAKGATVRASAATAAELAQTMQALPPIDDVMWLRGQDYAYDFSSDTRLRQAGYTIEAATVYAQSPQGFTPQALQQIARADRVIAPVYSAQSARRLGAAWPSDGPNLTLVAISFATAAAMLPAPGAVIVADEPSGAGVIEAVRRVMAAGGAG